MSKPLRRLCGLDDPRNRDPYVDTIERLDTRQLAEIKGLWRRYLPRIALYIAILGVAIVFCLELASQLILGYGSEQYMDLAEELDQIATITIGFLLGFFMALVALYSVLDEHLTKRLDEAETRFFNKE